MDTRMADVAAPPIAVTSGAGAAVQSSAPSASTSPQTHTHSHPVLPAPQQTLHHPMSSSVSITSPTVQPPELPSLPSNLLLLPDQSPSDTDPASALALPPAPAALATPPSLFALKSFSPHQHLLHDPPFPLWIRRQVFEHSVVVPLLTSSAASKIDFGRLAAALAAATVTMDPDEPPAVTYDAWVTVAAEHAHLDSSDEAGIIVEALETNAPAAFSRCNDLDRLAPGLPIDYRRLLIPVPELVAFIRLHAAAIIAARFRENADAVWPATTLGDVKQTPSSPLSSPSMAKKQQQSALEHPQHFQQSKLHQQPSTATSSIGIASSRATPSSSDSGSLHTSPSRSPGISPPLVSVSAAQSSAPVSTLHLSSAAAPGSPHPPTPGSPVAHADALARKKSQPSSPSAAMLNSSSAIVASVTHSLQRETHLVAANLASILKSVAATYGIMPHELVGPATGSILDRMGNTKDPMMPHFALSAPECTTDETLSDIDPLPGAVAQTRGPSSGLGQFHLSRLGTGSSTGISTAGFGAITGSASSDTSGSRAASGLMISRSVFEHLSFLLTCSRQETDRNRSISSIVPEWRDPLNNDLVSLNRVVDLTVAALTRSLTDPGPVTADTVEILGVERKTLLRDKLHDFYTISASRPYGQDVRISNCLESNIYLLCPLGRVSFIGCRECTLFVGSCVSVSIIGCDRVRVHTIARICRLTNCFDTTIYLCTNRRPQIVGENRRVTFAPYNVAYPNARLDASAVGVDPDQNVWNQFYQPNSRSAPGSSGTQSSHNSKGNADASIPSISLLPPQRFLPFAVPILPSENDFFSTRSDTSEKASAVLHVLFKFGLPLPPDYAKSIEERRQIVETLCRHIRHVDSDVNEILMNDDPTAHDRNTGYRMSSTGVGLDACSPSGRRLRTVVQGAVQGRFRDWLISTGNMRQIVDLMRLDGEGSRDAFGKLT